MTEFGNAGAETAVFRTPDDRLVCTAGAWRGRPHQGHPLTLETRGDSDEVIAAYEHLGFRLVEYIPGWELELGKTAVSHTPG